MIEAITYKKGVRHVDLSNINLSKNSYLIYLHNPDMNEIKSVSDLTKVYMSDIKKCLDRGGIPRVEARDNYLLIIFRAVHVEGNKTTPFGVALGKKFIVLVHADEIKPINNLVKDVDIKLFSRGGEEIVYKIFSDAMRDFSGNLEKCEESVDDLEKNVLKLQEQILMNKMFSIKKSLVYYRKALLRNRDVLSSLQNVQPQFIKKKGLFNPLLVESMQLIDFEELIKDRLTALLEINVFNASNRLNEIIKSFTVIASILLMPLLISGIYGMNFKILPLADHPYGFYIILGAMLGSVVLTYLFFKLRKWI